MGAMTAAGWMAVAAGTSAAAGIYTATRKQKVPESATNVPTAEQTDEVAQARDRRRSALGGGMAGTILAGNTSQSGSSGKTLLGQ